jgi:hypothetical protein
MVEFDAPLATSVRNAQALMSLVAQVETKASFVPGQRLNALVNLINLIKTKAIQP